MPIKELPGCRQEIHAEEGTYNWLLSIGIGEHSSIFGKLKISEASPETLEVRVRTRRRSRASRISYIFQINSNDVVANLISKKVQLDHFSVSPLPIPDFGVVMGHIKTIALPLSKDKTSN